MTISDHRFEALLGPAAPLIAAVFDALPDAIGIHWPVRDEGGALIDFALGYSNPSGARVIGVDLSNSIGERLLEVMPGVVELGVYDRLVRVVELGEIESSEIEFDTTYRGHRVQATWMHTVLPFGEGVMSMVFDLTEAPRPDRSRGAAAAGPGPRPPPPPPPTPAASRLRPSTSSPACSVAKATSRRSSRRS